MNHLIVMARRPELGKGKTRLAESIGSEQTLKVYQFLLDLTLGVANSSYWKTYLFLAGEAPYSCEYNFEEHEQSEGNLGDKMKNAFQTMPLAAKVVMIGTDCPEITGELIAQAYQELETKNLVFGPSEDGGYYLIGMNPYKEEMLDNISWSTEQVLDQSIARCKELNLSFSLLKTLNDIDTIEDLRASILTSTFGY